jgi:hypothetical protein
MNMADEVQSTQPAEGTAAASPEGAQVAAAKRKKINKMTARELESKIESIEKANATGSKYYKQLLQRKSQLGI